MIEQVKVQLEQINKYSNDLNAMVNQHDKQKETPIPTSELIEEYNDVLEQEFIKDKKGQEFAIMQIEAAQKYLVTMFMQTPEGKRLSAQREAAFKIYRDDKLKSFLDSKKKGVKVNADVSE